MATAEITEQQSSPPQHKRPLFSWLSDRWMAFGFVIPTLAILLFIAIYPLVWSLSASFTDRSILMSKDDPIASVGDDNYEEYLNKDQAWDRFVVTGRIVGPSILIELVLGLGIAMLLNRKFTGRGLIMTMLLIPMMLSPVVVALFWRFMLEGEGVVNYIFGQVFGWDAILWRSDRKWIPWAIVLIDVWMWTPFMMLISLAGLSAVPKYLYEAADVDQAGAWFRFRHITLPMIAPLLLIGTIFRIMDAYKMIDVIFVFHGDRGGVGRAAQTAGMYVYDVAFKNFKTGEGSAFGYIMLIVIIAFANLLIRSLNNFKGQE